MLILRMATPCQVGSSDGGMLLGEPLQQLSLLATMKPLCTGLDLDTTSAASPL